jgi:hypothetical protein
MPDYVGRTRAAVRLLAYAHALGHRLDVVSSPPPLTLLQLACMLELDRRSCRWALLALARRGALRVLVHEGNRYEIRSPDPMLVT